MHLFQTVKSIDNDSTVLDQPIMRVADRETVSLDVALKRMGANEVGAGRENDV